MESPNRLDMLRSRKQHCCCKYCGGALEVRRMVFGNQDEEKIEMFCPGCEKMEYGVDRHIYAVAEYYVEEMGFSIYPDVENEQLQKQLNRAKIAEIISWGFSQLGYENDNGLKYPVEVDDGLLHEHVMLSMEALRKVLAEKEEM